MDVDARHLQAVAMQRRNIQMKMAVTTVYKHDVGHACGLVDGKERAELVRRFACSAQPETVP